MYLEDGGCQELLRTDHRNSNKNQNLITAILLFNCVPGLK